MGLGATASRIRSFLSRAARPRTWPSLRLSIVSRLSVAVGAVLILALSANLLLDHGMRILRVRDAVTATRTVGSPWAATSRGYPISHAARDAARAGLARLEANIERQRLSSEVLIAALEDFERTTRAR